MRVYTNSTVRNLINYGKFFVGLVVLFVLLSQAVKIWNNDPALQDLRNLINPEQTDQ
jgi:hypothetical protein